MDTAAMRRGLPFLFREVTQGEKKLRDLSNSTQFLPTMLQPKFKDYIEAQTERDRFIVTEVPPKRINAKLQLERLSGFF
ncbi:MAG: hypothetical protein AB4426_09965 [Xenococcaceae cyanobacterium]